MRLLAVVACLACATPVSQPPPAKPAPVTPGPEEEARATLGRFATSVREGRWSQAYLLLSARWRARLTPERLEADWRTAGPVGARALSRVEALLMGGAPLRAHGRVATLVVGEGKAASLVLEEGGWRVDALE